MSPDALSFDGMPPARVAKYRLLDFLGRGGFGEVYRAQDIHTNRLVALKLLWGATDTTRFVREVESHARLHHSNIAQIYDAGEWTDGRFYIALQLVDGSSLAAKLNDESSRDVVAAVQLVARVARAIYYAHENLVLHCDLKPSNILIDRRGVPFVSDFGIADLLDRARAPIVSATLPYAAPEQCEPVTATHHTIDRWTDVYALGTILYHLVTGRTPYPAELSREDRRNAFARGELPTDPSVLAASEPRALGRTPDRELDRICAHALAIKPQQRYPSADALADDLDRWAIGLPICGPQRKQPALRLHALSLVKRNPEALIGLLLVLKCLAIGGIVLYLAVHQIQAWFLTANRTSAQLQGQILASRFETYRRELSELAKDPHIARMFQSSASALPPETAEAAGQKLSAVNWRGGPDQFYFLDPQGCFVNYWPASAVSADVYSSWYGFRDYFTCAEELQRKGLRSACLSRVFRSEYDFVPNTLRMAAAVPVYGEDGGWLGVLAASWPVERSLTELSATMPVGLEAKTSVLVARDRERSQLKAAGSALPTCGSQRDATAQPHANPRVGPPPRDELVILPRSSPRDERYLSAEDTERIGTGVTSGVLSDDGFLDPRDGKRYVVGIAALNQHPTGERAADHAPWLMVAMDPDSMNEYTRLLRVIACLLWASSAFPMYILFVTLLRSDREKLRWLKGASQ